MYICVCICICIYICVCVCVYRVHPEHVCKCARVVAGRYYEGQQISTTLIRFRPLCGLHDQHLRQLSRNLMRVVLIYYPL